MNEKKERQPLKEKGQISLEDLSQKELLWKILSKRWCATKKSSLKIWVFWLWKIIVNPICGKYMVGLSCIAFVSKGQFPFYTTIFIGNITRVGG